MDFITGLLIVCLLLLITPALNEIRTIIQIVTGLFKKKIDLKEKYGDWALVTGCTDGIGRRFSFELAARGINIVLIGRTLSKLEALADELTRTHQVKTKTIVADFAKGREIFPSIREGLQDIEVGILVNNVGVQYTYPMYFAELPEQELWDNLNINLGSCLQLTHIILPGMVTRRRGAIINLSSASKYQPIPFMNLYAASKIYIDYFTEALRFEYRNSGVTIQCLAPFYVSTNINHFSKTLQSMNFFTPDVTTYVAHALESLGVVDNTSAFWPHRVQVAFTSLIPIWLKTIGAGYQYKHFRRTYLRNLLKPNLKNK